MPYLLDADGFIRAKNLGSPLTYESQRLLARYTAHDEEVFDIADHSVELAERLDASA